VDDVSFGSAILSGAWGFFVTVRPFHKDNRSSPQRSFPANSTAGLTRSENESWTFDPESSDHSAIEQSDRWVMG